MSMKLDLEQIKKITLGAVKVTQSEEGYNFFRFNEEEIKFYEARTLSVGGNFYKKHCSDGSCFTRN